MIKTAYTYYEPIDAINNCSSRNHKQEELIEICAKSWKKINKYKFIINDLSNPPPIKQYWSWANIDTSTEQDIKANLNREQDLGLLDVKIDDDFDEIFYQKEYPGTKDFYQPCCTNYNIGDKRRLFYHYKTYNNNYKNLSNVTGNST